MDGWFRTRGGDHHLSRSPRGAICNGSGFNDDRLQPMDSYFRAMFGRPPSQNGMIQVVRGKPKPMMMSIRWPRRPVESF